MSSFKDEVLSSGTITIYDDGEYELRYTDGEYQRVWSRYSINESGFVVDQDGEVCPIDSALTLAACLILLYESYYND